MAVFVLVVFMIRSVNAAYRVQCSPGPSSTHTSLFNRLTRPLRLATAELLHADTCLDSLDGSDRVLHIATWPTYGNETHVHLSGYTYALPTCAAWESTRHALFRSVVGLAGGYEEDGQMPPDYLSWSVFGAEMTLSTHATEQKHTKIFTGEYGHFEGFSRLSHEHEHGEMEVSVGTSGCQLEPSLQSKFRPLQAYIIPPKGVTIVSDVDDVLRESEVWSYKQMLLSTFKRSFKPWSDEELEGLDMQRDWGVTFRYNGSRLGSMPQAYQQWAQLTAMHHQDVHFHYASDAPEMSHKFYVDGVTRYYPQGTFDFRPMVFENIQQVSNTRYDNVRRLIETFPRRQFILVGDTQTPSLLYAYSKLAREFKQITCILLREVRATEPAAWYVPDLKQLADLNRTVLFDTPRQLSPLVARLTASTNVTAECEAMHSDLRGASGGFVRSTIKAVREGYKCWLLNVLEERPSPRCIFDRRGLLKYPPVEIKGTEDVNYLETVA